jgi:hypothetical protein
VITGRVSAASPRSASQISPGCGLIKQVEDLLFDGARARYIDGILVGEFRHFHDARAGLSRQFLRQGVDAALLLSLLV